MIGYHLGALYLALYALDDPLVPPVPVVRCVDSVFAITPVVPGGACELPGVEAVVDLVDPFHVKTSTRPAIPKDDLAPGGACATALPLAPEPAPGGACTGSLPLTYDDD